MDKLKYDSFYKFLVSLGIILITLPFAGLIYIANFKVNVINQKEYENLSDYTVRSLEHKQHFLEMIDRYYPKVMPFLFCLGCICLLAGGVYWFRMQRLLDKQLRSDTIKKEIEVQQLTPLEIVNEKSKEIEEEEKSEKVTEDDNKTPISETDTAPSNAKADTAKPSGGIAEPSSPIVGELTGKAISSALTHSAKLLKTLTVEAKVIEKLTQKYSSKYDIRSNIKIDNTSFDAIAFSQLGDEPDIVFEIRYYQSVDKLIFLLIYDKLMYLKNSYKERYGKNCKLILIIVCPKEMISSFQKTHYHNIGYEIWAEEDLFDNNN